MVDAPAASAPARLNRTCQPCRIRKIRCAPGDSPSQCARCAKLSIECVAEAPAVRRKRTRNDTRIRDLERQVQDLRDATFESERATSATPSFGALPGTSLSPAVPSPAPSTAFSSVASDPFTDGTLTDTHAIFLYTIFHAKLAPLYPLVTPPSPDVIHIVQTERPGLFRAAVTAASLSASPEIAALLYAHTEQYIINEIMVLGNRSPQLVEAALILATWNHPPKKFQNVNFNQMANMAATAVVDMRSSNNAAYKVPSSKKALPATDQLLELSRTYLATYFLSSSIAMSYRRPNTLRYGTWIDDCLYILNQSGNLSDLKLAAWVRVQRTAEENLSIVGLDDGEPIDMTDPRTASIVKRCIEDVEQWRLSTIPEVLNGSVLIHYHMINLTLHEPSLYHQHKPTDFYPPYSLEKGDESAATNIRDICIMHASALLQVITGYELEAIREIPIVIYVRMMHAVVVLMKLSDSASSAEFHGIVSNLRAKLTDASEHGKFLVPRLFSHILQQLSRWSQDAGRQHGSTIQPLLALDQANAEVPSENQAMQLEASSEAVSDNFLNMEDNSMWQMDFTDMSFLQQFGGDLFSMGDFGPAEPNV